VRLHEEEWVNAYSGAAYSRRNLLGLRLGVAIPLVYDGEIVPEGCDRAARCYGMRLARSYDPAHVRQIAALCVRDGLAEACCRAAIARGRWGP